MGEMFLQALTELPEGERAAPGLQAKKKQKNKAIERGGKE